MDAHTPEQTVLRFADRLGAGDLEGAVALYDEHATFLPEPGAEVVGAAAIRKALGGFFALRPTLTGDIQRVVTAGDTALVVNDWKLNGTLPDGTPVTRSGRSADILRRRADGRWLLLIDNPWAA